MNIESLGASASSGIVNLFSYKQVVLCAIGKGTKYCQDFYVVLMKFVYLGSQTYDGLFSVLEVFFVFRKMVISGVRKDYVFLLIVLSVVFSTKKTTL